MSSRLPMATFSWPKDIAARAPIRVRPPFPASRSSRKTASSSGRGASWARAPANSRRLTRSHSTRVVDSSSRTVATTEFRSSSRTASSLKRGASSDAPAMFISIPAAFYTWLTRSRARGTALGGRRGVRIARVTDGKVTYLIPPHQTDRPEGMSGEGVTVDAKGNVYSAEVGTDGGLQAVRGLTKHVPRSPLFP